MLSETTSSSSDWRKKLVEVLGLIGLLSGTASSILTGWEKTSYVFVGLLALAVAFYLLQRFRTAWQSDRRAWWQMAWPIVGLAVVIVLAGGWAWWTFTRPWVEITDVRVNHDIALETLLGDYEPAKTESLDLSAAILAYRSGEPAVVDYINACVREGVSLSPIALEITVENLVGRNITIHETRIRAIQACGLIDCFTYGELPELTGPGYMVLCPWWNEEDLRGRPPVTVAGPGDLTASESVQTVTVYLANDLNTQACLPAVFGRLAVALYEIQVSVVYGRDHRIASYEPMLIAIPDLTYSMLGQGEIWLEKSDVTDPTPDDVNSCRLANADRSQAILALADERWIDPWVRDKILPEYWKVEPLLDL